MKRYIWLSILLLTSVLMSAQTQQGYVKTKGRLGSNGSVMKGSRLSGATVIVKGRNAVVSGSNGSFTLAIPGNNYYLQDVQKTGYVLTDPDVLSKQYVQSKNPLVLVMETPDEQLEDKLEAMAKIRTTLQNQLERSRAEMKSLKEQNRMTQEEYQRKLQELYAIQESNEKLVNDMAERYSKIDYDQLDAFNALISKYILDGELQKADSLLKTKGDIIVRTADLRQLQEQNAKDEEELTKRKKKLEKNKELAQKELEDIAQDCFSKFEIFKMQHQNDSAAYYIEYRSSLDTTNVEWQTDAAAFLFEFMAKYDDALTILHHTLKAIGPLTDDSPRSLQMDVEEVYFTMGAVLDAQGKPEEARNYLKKAHDIVAHAVGENNGAMASIYLNLAGSYAITGEYEQVGLYSQKALDICLAINDTLSLNVAQCYNGLGLAAKARLDNETAMTYYSKALSTILKVQGEENSFAASYYGNIGVIYRLIGNIEKSIEFTLKSLNIRKLLFHENHPSLVPTYISIGNACIQLKKGEEAKSYFEKALDIQARLGENNITMAMIYGNLGTAYCYTRQYNEALAYYDKGIELFRKFGDASSMYVSASIAAKVIVYILQGNMDEAEANARISAQISPQMWFGQTAHAYIQLLQGIIAEAESVILKWRDTPQARVSILGDMEIIERCGTIPSSVKADWQRIMKELSE